MQAMISELTKKFQTVDLSVLNEMEDMISSKIDNEILPPYVPFIGKSFSKHRVLVYATAQNISHGQAKGFEWSDPINRLYPNTDSSDSSRDEAQVGDIPIEPWRRGVLPALVGLFLYAKLGEEIHDLELVQDHVAISNYYKFSLSDGEKDINPAKIPIAFKDMYLQLANKLVGDELDTLKPNYVFWFNGYHQKSITEKCRDCATEEYKINDPAWIRRGQWNCLKSTGSWGKAVESARSETSNNSNHFVKAEKLVCGYHDQIVRLNKLKCDGKQGRYGSESMEPAIKYYLMHYYLQFIK